MQSTFLSLRAVVRKGGLSRFIPFTETSRVLRALWPYVWPEDRPDLRRTVVWSFVVVIIAKAVTIGVPFTLKWATDALVAASGGHVASSQTLPWLVGSPVLASIFYGLSRIVMSLLVQIREGMFARVAMHAVRKLALSTFEHMHRLSLRFHLERKTGGLTRVLERGRTGIENISRMALMTLIPTIVEFLMIIAVCMFEFDWRYIVTIVGMIAAYLWFTIRATDWRLSIRRVMNESDADANTKAIDSLLNYETVKYFGAEGYETTRYDKSMAAYEKASIRTYTSLAMLNSGQVIVFTVGLTICLVMSANDVAVGKDTVGHFAMVNLLMLQLFMPLNFMGMVYREIKQGLTDIEHMMEVLEQNPEVADRPGAKTLGISGCAIKFDHVRFGYDSERFILKDISFEVPTGKMVAIVGPSGAGKSTVGRLLLRFYDVTSGRILINGQDIHDVTQSSLRSAIGVVPQDTMLFNDTIFYNIKYGRVDATDDEVYAAAKLAQIDDFVRALPDGYATMVGERGLKLSGGEKQRVAIARTILKAPPILLLDEATSALDSHTEKEIQDALDRVSKDRTTVVIAHRLSTIVHADMILVFEAGRVAEHGTHADLIAKNGFYASLWVRQRQAERAREDLAHALEAVGELPLRGSVGGRNHLGASRDGLIGW